MPSNQMMPPPNMPPVQQRPTMYNQPPQQYMNTGNMAPNMGAPSNALPNMMNVNRNLGPVPQQQPIHPQIPQQTIMNNRMQAPVGTNPYQPQQPINTNIPLQPNQMNARPPIMNAQMPIQQPPVPPQHPQQQQPQQQLPNSTLVQSPQLNQAPTTPSNQSLKRPANQMQSSMAPNKQQMTTPNQTVTSIQVNATTQPPASNTKSNKKKKLADKILPQKIRDLVPESQAYMELLAFERKLDFTITRKRLDIQEALKRPMKQKRKLRIFISNTFYGASKTGKLPDGDPNADANLNNDLGPVPGWELRVEGRLLDDQNASKPEQNKMKRKFSSFFKSLVIELDKDLYGPDNHLVEWHRTATTNETDGFQGNFF